MLKPCFLAFVDDPSFRSQVETIVHAKGGEVYFATEGEQLSQLAKTLRPFMVMVDLTELDAEWIFRHISTIVNNSPHLPVLAFVDSDIPKAARVRAERYGCRQVILKNDLIAQLPNIVEKALAKRF